MLGCVTVIDDNVVYNPSVACESSEGFIHPAVVVLRYGRDPYGARRYLNLPNGAMNVVRSWLCSSRGHWWYPLRASNFVKILVFSSAMSAKASADWYLSRFTNLFRRERSTHIRILSVPFLGVTTMGAHHSVGTVTGVMTPCSCCRSNSAFSLSRYANGFARGAWMQNGWASSVGGDVELFPLHCLDVSIEDRWELTPDVGSGCRVAGSSE